jgi:hypothetical protein
MKQFFRPESKYDGGFFYIHFLASKIFLGKFFFRLFWKFDQTFFIALI